MLEGYCQDTFSLHFYTQVLCSGKQTPYDGIMNADHSRLPLPHPKLIHTDGKSLSLSFRLQSKSWHCQIGSSWVILLHLSSLRGQGMGSFGGVSLLQELEVQSDLFQPQEMRKVWRWVVYQRKIRCILIALAIRKKGG